MQARATHTGSGFGQGAIAEDTAHHRPGRPRVAGPLTGEAPEGCVSRVSRARLNDSKRSLGRALPLAAIAVQAPPSRPRRAGRRSDAGPGARRACSPRPRRRRHRPGPHRRQSLPRPYRCPGEALAPHPGRRLGARARRVRRPGAAADRGRHQRPQRAAGARLRPARLDVGAARRPRARADRCQVRARQRCLGGAGAAGALLAGAAALPAGGEAPCRRVWQGPLRCRSPQQIGLPAERAAAAASSRSKPRSPISVIARANGPEPAAGLRSDRRRCRLAPAVGAAHGRPPRRPRPRSRDGWTRCRLRCRQGCQHWNPAPCGHCQPPRAGRAARCRLGLALPAEGAEAAAGTAPAPRDRDSQGAVLRRPRTGVCGRTPYLLLS